MENYRSGQNSGERIKLMSDYRGSDNSGLTKPD